MQSDRARTIINDVRGKWGCSTADLLGSPADELEGNLDYEPVEGVTLELLMQALYWVRLDQQRAE